MDGYAGSPKFEIRINVAPKFNSGYSRGSRIGIHTIGDKHVHGFEFLTFGYRELVQTKYMRHDSFISRQTYKSARSCFGLSYTYSRNFYFSSPQLIATIGLQAFAGMNRKIETIGPVYIDSQFTHTQSTFDMLDLNVIYRNKVIKHSFQPSAALALVIGIKASVNRRITLIPELRLPFVVNFNSSNNYDYLQPGVSLSLGYKVGIGKRSKTE